VTNWSHGDPRVRIRLPVGVAYGTDPEKLRNILLEVAKEHPKVLADPAPDVFFNGFGDSSLNFELAVWTAEMSSKPRRFRSELYYAMEKKLRENKIEVPFPQQNQPHFAHKRRFRALHRAARVARRLKPKTRKRIVTTARHRIPVMVFGCELR